MSRPPALCPATALRSAEMSPQPEWVMAVLYDDSAYCGHYGSSYSWDKCGVRGSSQTVAGMEDDRGLKAQRSCRGKHMGTVIVAL